MTTAFTFDERLLLISQQPERVSTREIGEIAAQLLLARVRATIAIKALREIAEQKGNPSMGVLAQFMVKIAHTALGEKA